MKELEELKKKIIKNNPIHWSDIELALNQNHILTEQTTDSEYDRKISYYALFMTDINGEKHYLDEVLEIKRNKPLDEQYDDTIEFLNEVIKK